MGHRSNKAKKIMFWPDQANSAWKFLCQHAFNSRGPGYTFMVTVHYLRNGVEHTMTNWLTQYNRDLMEFAVKNAIKGRPIEITDIAGDWNG